MPNSRLEPRPRLPGALDRVSIAVVDGSSITYASFGANEHTQYEIGSITKTFTGLLLADAIRRGEVNPDTKVSELPPLRDAPIADVTLAELASHRSGLSAQGMGPNDAIPFAVRYLEHRDPFTQDVDGVLAVASKATPTNRGAFVYSNLGTAVLGHALAAAAHKNGLTAGFTSKLILDRANHRAVIVLSNTAAEVDEAANNLLVGEYAWISSP